jgi:GNAT superfamily N-acetyltransferase
MSQASQRSSSDLARAIGARVTIRLREPSGGFRDIVGVLQSFGEGIGELANSKGEVLNFSESEIAIWREVKALPDRAGTGAPYSLRINELEALSDATWPADEINEIGKWRLRISDGFTMRANSVLPAGAAPYGEPGLEIGKAVEEVTEIYKRHGLTPTFTIPLPVYEELDSYLDQHGWEVKVGAEFLVNDIPTEIAATSSEFQIINSDSPSQEWLEIQSDFALERIMRNYPSTYTEIKEQGQIIARGRIATKGTWSLATRVFVHPEFRGRGIGNLLMRAMMAEARVSGATKIGLQVDVENGAALALYKAMGFRFHHHYNYRVLNSAGAK